MRALRTKVAIGAIVASGALLATALEAQAPTGAASAAAAARPPVVMAWTPKKDPPGDYPTPNRAWWKFADVLAMHAREKSWVQPIIRNKDLIADWHQLAAGAKTDSVMSADSRIGLIVWSGQVRVSVEGKEPFVASKGFEIDVPFRVPFSLETVGAAPALWFEIHDASDVPIYPGAAPKPKDIPGRKYQQVILSGGPGTWDDTNKPYLDYYKDVVGGSTRAGAFIASDHLFVNNIRGKGVPTPPPANLGHFHVNYDEFWFIMEGNIDYQIQGVPFMTAGPGDIVTAAAGRWHRASFGGPVGQMDTRVAINPFPRGLHNFTPNRRAGNEVPRLS